MESKVETEFTDIAVVSALQAFNMTESDKKKQHKLDHIFWGAVHLCSYKQKWKENNHAPSSGIKWN